MATNESFDNSFTMYVAVPSGTVAGSPVVFGQLPGVALTSRDGNGNATIQTRGIFNLSVKGIDGSGNHAIAAGDILYYTGADTPPVSAKATGVRYGYAKAAVTSGSTASIDVILGY